MTYSLEQRGEELASLLNTTVDSAIDDGLAFGDVKATRADIIERIADEAGISANAVNQIMRGLTVCPTLASLEAFASVLSVGIDSLVSAAEEDGCTYERSLLPREQDVDVQALLNRQRVVSETREREQAELRRVTVPLDGAELRKDGDTLKFRGLAAVFGEWSEDLWGFREKITRGAFRKVLSGKPDVRFLFNHNPNDVLARTTAGTMELRESSAGLVVNADLAPTQLGNDIAILIERRDVDAMSFGFRVGKDKWHWPDQTDDEPEPLGERTITEFSDLYDVGPVTFPAYADTTVEMRSFEIDGRIVSALEPKELTELSWQIHRGEVSASSAQRASVDRALESISTVSPWAAERALRAACDAPELLAAVPRMTATVELKPTPSRGDAEWRIAARQRRLHLNQRIVEGG